MNRFGPAFPVRRSFLLAVVLWLGAHSVSAAENRTALLERIDALVAGSMERDQVVGTSVGVHKDGELWLAKGYGFADLENRVPATEHTVYRIGSITKQFTAAAILQLEERDRLRLTDSLTSILPDYDASGHRITVEQLLNHTSGIRGYTEMGEKFWGRSRLDLTHEEMVELFSSEPFDFAPGADYRYNNSAYYLLGLIIEEISGQSYADYLAENVWTPLGMRESHYLYNDPIVSSRAAGYEVRDGRVVNDAPLSMHLPYSAGALGSSVSDLITWQLALARGRVVNARSFEKMTTPASLESGRELTYGYGLMVGRMGGHRKISHGGGINGFRTQLAYYPDDDLTVVVLSNTGTARPGPLESAIARAVLELPEAEIEETKLSPEELSVYAGTYDPGRAPVRVSVDDQALRLFGERLRPVGDHVFFPEGDDYRRITFVVENGKSVQLIMEREGQRTVAPRVP